jgi:hypothetical protein
MKSVNIEVKESWIDSTFHGLFATEIIEKQSVICEYRGALLNTVGALRTVDKSYLMRLSPQIYIDAKDSPECLARSIIHICIYVYVCAYMHIYMCVYMNRFVYICIHIYIYISVCVYMYIYVQKSVYINKYLCKYVCAFVHMYIHMNMRISVYMYTCISVCIYTCIFIRISSCLSGLYIVLFNHC